MRHRLVRISKFLSYVLRHHPDAAGVQLDEAGWVDVDALLAGLQAAGRDVDRALLERVVETDAKQRYEFDAAGTRLRACQGHSVPVELGLEATTPPAVLFHGTATRFLDAIREQGLMPRGRRHVHLSPDAETAAQVGCRHGQLVVLTVDAEALARDGQPFYRSTNGVWLTEHVPPDALGFPE